MDAKLLIEQKLALFQTIATVSITWWVSISVFHGTLIAWVWLSRDALQGMRFRQFAVLCAGSFLMLLSIVHGFRLLSYFKEVDADLQSLLKMATLPTSTYQSELEFAKAAIRNGSLSLIGMLAIFWALLVVIRFGRSGVHSQMVRNRPQGERNVPYPWEEW